ncbi:MAG: HEAT repeat domain-containing protein [Acidimicrobiales bacterium]
MTSRARAAIGDPAPTVRVAGLRSLARLGLLDAATLTAALHDPAAGVRIAAAELGATPPRRRPRAAPRRPGADGGGDRRLGGRRTAPASEASLARLIALSGTHPDPLVRESAVAALGALGDPRALPAVLEATRDKPAVRRRAVLALAAFDGPEVDAAWERARHDRDRQVRDAVEELLGPADAG